MPTITTTLTQTGGKRLQRLFREAGRGGVREVEIGFFSTARYPDGTQVAAVAAWNEFGTQRIPERPFFRQAIQKIDDGLAQLIRRGIDVTRMVVSPRLAGVIGEYAKDTIQQSITDLDTPPNAPSTIERKAGKRTGRARQRAIESNNPLIETGRMRSSVSYRVR